jgi:hypothetical protein
MAKAIATNKIGGDLYSASDLIFEDQNLANAGATTSAEFLLAQTMGGTQVNIIAGAAGCATAAAQTLTFTVVTSPTSGGTFDDTIWTEIMPASTTYAAGALIASFVVPRDISEMYAKLVATSDADMTADEITAYQVGLAGS